MKSNIIPASRACSCVFAITVFATVFASAQTYPNSAISNGTPGVDTTLYTESSPGLLTVDNGGSITAEMLGTPGATGGNLELFSPSDGLAFYNPANGGAFSQANHIELAVSFSSYPPMTFSSLNGQDWFTTSGGTYSTAYGANNLANQWFNSFMNETPVGAIIDGVNPAFRANAYGHWANTGGFAQISDPNIAYTYYDSSGAFHFGLGSFFDDSPQIREWLLELDPSGQLAALVPDGIQVSEAVKVNGQVMYDFSNAQASGVVAEDGSSYTAAYHFTVPEPSSALMALLSLAVVLRRKRS